MLLSKISYELFIRIQRDPDAAVDRKLLTLIPANCVLSKRMRGIFDHMDQLYLSATVITAINYIAEHDYLAYLTFLERYDQIRETFWEKDLFARKKALVSIFEKKDLIQECQETQQKDHKNNTTSTIRYRIFSEDTYQNRKQNLQCRRGCS